MTLNTRTLILLAGTIFLSFASFAQMGFNSPGRLMYEYNKANSLGFGNVYHRYSLGYTLNFMNASISQHYQEYNEFIVENGQSHPHPNGDPVDTSFTLNLKSKGSWGMFLNAFFPISKMGENSCLAISAEIMAGMYSWTTDSINYSPHAHTKEDLTGLQFGFPVGLDYRFGGDAVLDKSQRLMLTVGAGVTPSLVATTYGSAGDVLFKVLPYVKAEVGFFAGIAFKLRLSAHLGTVDYGTQNLKGRFGDSYNNRPNDETDINIKTKSSYSLGLIIMPFSWGWEQGY